MMFRSLALLGLAQAAAAVDFEMESVPVPGSNEDKHMNIASSSIVVNDVNYNTGYHNILRSGDSVDGVVFGAVLDKEGQTIFSYPMTDDYVEIPVDKETGAANAADEAEPLISTIIDFTSLIDVTGSGETDFVMFAHFETPLPASIYRVDVDFNATCNVLVNKLEAVDWSDWEGLWEPCSAKVTPWNTHMGSEEHEPDAKVLTWDFDTFMQSYKDGEAHALNILHFVRYYGIYSDAITDQAGLDEVKKVFNPYKYGHITELSVNDKGETEVQKWYTTGRVSIENPEIMGDKKNIYIADDGNHGVLTRFEMDTAEDMTSGKLYAAKFTQSGSQTTEVSRTYEGIEWDIEWVELGSATQAELEEMVEGLTYDQIFDEVDLNDDGTCPEGYTLVKAGWDTVRVECLSVKEGMEKAAAFFETRRYAHMLGGTTELQNTEGLAFVPDEMKFYSSFTKVTGGMEETLDPQDHIKVPANPCGCVFEFDVDDTMVLTKARGFLCGEATTNDDGSVSCADDSIASPDNLFYMGFADGGPHRMLIAEDSSGKHQNNFLWSYNFENKELTRILSSVYGSQVTGPGFFSDGQGCYLLTAVVPHPYKKSDRERVEDDESMGLGGILGYIGPIGSRSDEL